MLFSASTKVLKRLILDMAKPLYGKGMTINFNNYYGSPAVTIELLKHEVCCQGTLRKNKRLIPSYILFTKSEARDKEARGAAKVTVNKKYGLVAVGWIDGNPVHMISSADTEKMATVQRQIGEKKHVIQAPEVVLKYNKGTDGVDRHDQYRALFSLCKNHGFKKYSMKLMLALLDISLTNAVFHFKLHWKDSDCPNSRMSRADFLQDIAKKLISSNREWELEDEPGIEAILGSNTDFSPESNSSISQLLQRNIPEGVAVSLCEAKRGCVYEAFEKYSGLLKKNIEKMPDMRVQKERYREVQECYDLFKSWHQSVRVCTASKSDER